MPREVRKVLKAAQKKQLTGVKFSPRMTRSTRSAPHPGVFLETQFLQPLAISQAQLAKDLGISRRRVNELVVGKRSITPDTAIKLSLYFDTDPEFWLILQMRWDLRQALEKLKDESTETSFLK